MVVLVLVLVAMIVVAAVVIADVARAVRQYRRVRVTAGETAPSGRQGLRDGRYFVILLGEPQAPTRLRLYVAPDRTGPGAPRFSCDVGPVKIVHRDAAGVLLHVFGRGSWIAHLAFVYVVDPSTGQPSLLRVPPGMRRARQAVAWTFGMEEREWAPAMET